MFEQTLRLHAGDDADEEAGSNGHSSQVITAVESDINNETPRLSQRTAPPCRNSSKGSLSVCSSPHRRGLRRAFVIGRRGSPSTPVPSWKVSDNSIFPAHHHHHHHCHHPRHLEHGYADQGIHISARKLAACLWELENSPFGQETGIEEDPGLDFPQMNTTSNPAKQISALNGQHLSPACSRISRRLQKRLPIHMKSRDSGKTRARMERWTGQQFKPPTIAFTRENNDDSNTTHPLGITVISSKDALSNMDGGRTNAGELLKVLNHVASLEEQHASSLSLVNTLRSELEDAQSQLLELLSYEKSHWEDVENISRQIAEQRAQWEDQQEQTIMVAVQSAQQELENERKSKKKLEVLHKKMAREFRDARKIIARASEDLERERKARQLMEEVCDELAREVGEDKARVLELKRESAKVREEVEEERKMLQMAEVWREERVQMKLMEAKLELEDKNTALDKVRSQLEAFLLAKRAGDLKDGGDHAPGDYTRLDAGGRSVDLVTGRRLSDILHFREKRDPDAGRKSVDSCNNHRSKQACWMSDSDVDDDLHSIQLNIGALVRTAGNKGGSHSSVQNDAAGYQEKWSSDEKVLAGSMSESGGMGGRSNLSDRRERQGIKAEEGASVGFLQGLQGIEAREGRQTQQSLRGESSCKSWLSDTDDTLSQISYSPKAMASTVSSQSKPEGQEAQQRASKTRGPGSSTESQRHFLKP